MSTIKIVALFLLLLCHETLTFADAEDTERLNSLRDLIAKEELRTLELMSRILRMRQEIGYPRISLSEKLNLRQLDSALVTMQEAPKYYLTRTEISKINAYFDYNNQNVDRAFAALQSRAEPHYYIILSHIEDFQNK